MNLVKALTFGLLLFAAPAAEAADVTLLYNSSVQAELHDCGCKTRLLGGLARRAAMIEDVSAKSDVLLLDAGNLFGDPTRDTRAQSEFVAAQTAAMGYAAVGVGPYEIGHGIDAVQAISLSSGLEFVNANITVAGEHPFAPWTVVERGGVRFGVIGVIDPRYDREPYNAKVEGLVIQDPVTALKRELPKLAEASDVVVLLSSMQSSNGTVDILRALDGEARIDLVIEGAVARQYKNPRKLGDSLVLAANTRGKYLGQLDLTVVDGAIASATGEVHPIDVDLPEHEEVARRVEEFEAAHETVAATN
jgi:2',3'-cyclic-nucleotide 2'-phosphodiesterase (5'-nucleotidase family)